MADQTIEQRAREKVRILQHFYRDCFIFGAINVGILIIWALSGGGYFWPIWVIVGSALSLTIRGAVSGILPLISDYFPFFSQDWEDKKVQELIAQDCSATPPSLKKKREDTPSA